MLRSRSAIMVLLLAATVMAMWQVEWHMGLFGTIDHVLGALLVLSLAVFAAVVVMTVREVVRRTPVPAAPGSMNAGPPGWPDQAAQVR